MHQYDKLGKIRNRVFKHKDQAVFCFEMEFSVLTGCNFREPHIYVLRSFQTVLKYHPKLCFVIAVGMPVLPEWMPTRYDTKYCVLYILYVFNKKFSYANYFARLNPRHWYKPCEPNSPKFYLPFVACSKSLRQRDPFLSYPHSLALQMQLLQSYHPVSAQRSSS